MYKKEFEKPVLEFDEFLSVKKSVMDKTGRIYWLGDGVVYHFWQSPSPAIEFLANRRLPIKSICYITQTIKYEVGDNEFRIKSRAVFVEDENIFNDLMAPWLELFEKQANKSEVFALMVDDTGKFIPYQKDFYYKDYRNLPDEED